MGVGKTLSDGGRETQVGNTPTGVGKTNPVLWTWQFVQKHPHGRGEDLFHGLSPFRLLETPPRAWGRQRER